MEYKLLALDTSSSSTGWALYINGDLIQYDIIDLKNIKDGQLRMRQMIFEIYKIIDKCNPNIIVTEMTVVLRNPAVQRMLTMILGAIYGKCIMDNIEYESLRPTEWRKYIEAGKKPKKRDELKKWSKYKVLEIFNIDCINDDLSDAILIGRAWINHLSNM